MNMRVKGELMLSFWLGRGVRAKMRGGNGLELTLINTFSPGLSGSLDARTLSTPSTIAR